MTHEEMKQIFDTEIPYNNLIKNGGIYLFYEDKATDISIGISYEYDDDGKEVYVYNLFIDQDEYIGFGSVGINEDKEKIICELVDAWNQFTPLDSIHLENDNSKKLSILGGLEAAKIVVAENDKKIPNTAKKREAESL